MAARCPTGTFHYNSQPRRRHRRIAAIALLAAATPSVAAVVDWLPNAPSPSSFSDPANWSAGVVPTSADTARFNTATAHTVTLAADTTTDRLVLANASLTLDMAGRNYTATGSNPVTPSLQVGSNSALTLTTSAGPSLFSTKYVALAPAAADSASLTVTGPGTQWAAASAVYAGYRGTGYLAVRNGASVSISPELDVAYYPGSVGTVSIQDAGSSLTASSLYVGGYSAGAGGTGTVDVLAGGALTVTNSVTLWNAANSSLNLAGGSLKFGSLAPGSDPSRFHWTAGSLELTNSSVVVSATTNSSALNLGPTFALNPSMSLRVNGSAFQSLTIDDGSLSAAGSPITINAQVNVGAFGTGTFALSDGASLTSTEGRLATGYTIPASGGPITFGSAAVSLNTASSWTINGPLSVGTAGAATLTIKGGSSVSNNLAYAGGSVQGSAVTVDGAGSAWTCTGVLYFGYSGGASLAISNGAAVSSPTAFVGYSSSQTPTSVTLQGPGSSWVNTGSLTIARAPSVNAPANAAVSLSDHAVLSTRTLSAATASPYASAALSLSSGSTLSVTTSAYLGGSATAPGGTATLSLTDSAATVGNTLKLWNTPNTSLSLTRSTLTVGTPAAPGALDNAASISLADHSTLTLHGTLVNAGTVSLSPGSLLLWDPASTPDLLATLRAQLATGHILPSPTAPTNYRPAYTFSGEPTAPTSITVTLALTGDTNLDGRIDPDDYALLDRAFARSLTDAHWTDGDFNYDGIINNQDYLLIDTAYGHAQGLSPQFLSLRESQFGATYAAALLTSVPEPSSLACLFAGSLLLPRRRHR